MKQRPINVMIAGEAGQGLVTTGEILAKTLVRLGHDILVDQDYMSRVRGGDNAFSVRVGGGGRVGPSARADILVCLSADVLEARTAQLAPGGITLTHADFGWEGDNVVAVPFDDLGPKRAQNVAALAVIAEIVGLDVKALLETIHGYFGKKGEEVMKKNEDTLDKASAWARENVSVDASAFKLPGPVHKGERLMMEGNQCIALGAVSAGLKFYSFYPMTPATSIGTTLAGWMDKVPLVVEQVEDEIAAINMALGASYAGATAMTGTSGGGLALMVEAVSLAGVSETPLVIALAQRGGPATGLPTRTEQGDLLFALHAGHGEFPRAMLAPGTPEQCFHLARKAFELAEKTQGPVFLLTDLFLSDTYRSVAPFDMSGLEPVKVGADPGEVEKPYRRYRFTDSGVSPRLVPGAGEDLVVADSHEHDEAGHITEDADLRTRMVDKRLRKAEMLREEFIPPDYYGGEGPDTLLVCWGSSLGACLEAADILADRGKTASVLHFTQVWPLEVETFADKLDQAKTVVGVESNATAQFTQLLISAGARAADKTVGKYDGRPMTAEHIIAALDAASGSE